MNASVRTKTFKTGNSVAVRLPKGFAIAADVEVTLERRGNEVVLRTVSDPEAEMLKLLDMLAELKALPKPPSIQKRERFEMPDRAGL